MLNAPPSAPPAVGKLAVLKRYVNEHGEELEEVTCPLCGQTDATLALEANDLLYDRPGNYRLVRCNGCSLSYVNPRPTPAALGAHYPEDYHCYRTVESYPRLVQPFVAHEVQEQATRRIKSIERVLGPIRPETEILDVGCGQNALLKLIRDTRRAVGLGIEMKPEMVAHIREELHMPVVEGTLLDADLESGRFDLAMMMEYLEHEPDPLRVLSEVRRVLKPGGHVIIEIPDPEGAPARLFGRHWVNLDLPRHLVFFDRKTLARALAETGFEVVSHERYSIPLYVGYSVALKFGASKIMQRWSLISALGYSLGVPFLPALRWLPEFSFVVARAI